MTLTSQDMKEFLQRGFTRRNFGQIATMMAGASALPFYNEPALAQLSRVRGELPPDAVMINANENPLGPVSGSARRRPQHRGQRRTLSCTAKPTRSPRSCPSRKA